MRALISCLVYANEVHDIIQIMSHEIFINIQYLTTRKDTTCKQNNDMAMTLI